MSLTPSNMLSLGTRAPDFELPNVTNGEIVSLENFSEYKALLVMFICRHCPYVRHVQEEIGKIGKDYLARNIGIVAISSNDAEKYPEDSPDSLAIMAEDLDFNFPYLYDEKQSVAKSYTAACTPDLFLFNKERELVYRGQFDDSRPDNGIPVTGKDIRDAMDAVLEDGEISPDQKPSMGCNIKWKPGNEPSYFGL